MNNPILEEKAYQLGRKYANGNSLKTANKPDMFDICKYAGLSPWFDIFCIGSRDVWREQGENV
jgi:hypothetical protein